MDKLWTGWVGWVFYWSTLVSNGVVFVWYFSSSSCSNWPSIYVMGIGNSWNFVFSLVFSNFSSNITEINWVGFSLFSSVNKWYEMGSGNILVSKGAVNLIIFGYN